MEEEEELSLLKEDDLYMNKSDMTKDSKSGQIEESNSDAADKVSETDLPEIEIPRPAF